LIQDSHVTFFHRRSKSTILIALHEPDDLSTSFDLARVRHLLSAKGLATLEQFDQLVSVERVDRSLLVQIEEWWNEGQDWVQQRIVEAALRLTRFVPNAGLPDFKTAAGDSEVRRIVGGSVVFEYRSLHNRATESLRLELRLFAEPNPSEIKLQATLFEGEVPASSRGQELILRSSGEVQGYRLRLSYGGAFVPCDDSPDPYQNGIQAKSAYTLVLRVRFNKGIAELRIPNIDFAGYISALSQRIEGV
jgi:hypothetical protein